MEKYNYINNNRDKEVWDGEVGELYLLLYGKRFNWQYFIKIIEKRIRTREKHSQIKILDCACGGCGEPAISLALKGYGVWATDGYKKMLDKAREFAAKRNANITFSSEPIKFWELKEHYQENYFDILYCVANSISHVSPDKIEKTLKGIASILRSGGRIILDTKRYTESGREIIFDEKEGRALERKTKVDELKKSNKVLYFETSFSYPDKQNSLLAIYDMKITHQDGSISEYSLPFWRYSAKDLQSYLESLGLVSEILSPDISKWKYEIVIGIKRI